MNAMTRRIVIGTAAVSMAVSLAACGKAGDDKDSGSGGDSKTIGLLLPENKTTRYETFDRPMIEAKIKALCSDCDVKYNNAGRRRRDAEEAVRLAGHPGRQGHHPGHGRLQGREVLGPAGREEGREGRRVRPSRRGPDLRVHQLRQREDRPPPGRGARQGAGRQGEEQQRRHDQRLAARPERPLLQEGRAQRPGHPGQEGRLRAGHPGLVAGRGEQEDGCRPRLAGQERLPGRLLRERRHGRMASSPPSRSRA